MEAQTIDDPRSLDIDRSPSEARKKLAAAIDEVRRLGEGLEPMTTENADDPEQGDRVRRARQIQARLQIVRQELEGCVRVLDGEDLDASSGMPRMHPQGAEARRILDAQEQERSRLAEELHDGPAQALATASFQVEIIERSLRNDPDSVREELVGMRRLLARELEQLRGYIHQLRPAVDEIGGLASSIEELAADMGTATGIDVRTDLAAPEEWLDLAERTAVLRITQEALRNIRKHAVASRAWVETRVHVEEGQEVPDAWILEVRDDGRGFAQAEVVHRGRSRHFGLRFMRERAMLVGGSLEIGGAPSGGTTVRLTLDPRERSQA